jgi:hypothetical protein
MALFHLGEFRFVPRGAYRHEAAGTDGIDGSILVSSMRKRLIPNHASTPLGADAQNRYQISRAAQLSAG